MQLTLPTLQPLSTVRRVRTPHFRFHARWFRGALRCRGASSLSVPLAALASSLLVATSVVAQHTSPAGAVGAGIAPNPTPLAPFTDSIGTVNLPGFVAFALPQTYGRCEAAVRLAKHEANARDSSQDSLPEPLRRPRSLPPVVRAIGETCRTRVLAGNTHPTIPEAPELQSVFELAVLLGDSTGSIAALDRWLAAPQTLADRGESPVETHLKRLMSAVKLYYRAETPLELRAWSLGYAKTFVARLDSLGPKAHGARLLTQNMIVDAETEWRNQATGKFADPERVLHEYMALIPAYDSASGPDAGPYDGQNGARALPFNIRQVQSVIDESHVVPLLDSLAAHPSLNGNISRASGSASKSWTYMNTTGQPIPPLHARFWYNTHGDSVWPVPDHLSLLVIGDVSAGDTPFLRLLAQRYAAHGLRITLVNKTNGYWIRSGTETGPRTAVQEAAQDSAYYLGYLKLPMTVAIEETPFTKKPDGSFVQSAPVEYEHNWVGNSEPYILADAQGRILRRWGGFDERYVITYLDRLFGIKAP